MRLIACVTFSFILLLTTSRCRKKEDPQLPPETQTGAMTFGCKINGKVFVPRDARGQAGLFVEYAYLGTGPGGGWYLNIPAINWKPDPPESVNIGADSLLLEEGSTYSFKAQQIGAASAFYLNGKQYKTIDLNSGELHITKHDQQRHILSGTFFFTGTNKSTGEKVEITEGRFDIRY